MKKYMLSIAVASIACTPAFAQVPVTPAPDQLVLLKSSDPREAANKKLVFDFLRVVIDASHVEDVDKYLDKNFVEHNPNAAGAGMRRNSLLPTETKLLSEKGALATFSNETSAARSCVHRLRD